MPTYEFKITLTGTGVDEEVAWFDAVDKFVDEFIEPTNSKIKIFHVWDEDDERIGHK